MRAPRLWPEGGDTDTTGDIRLAGCRWGAPPRGLGKEHNVSADNQRDTNHLGEIEESGQGCESSIREQPNMPRPNAINAHSCVRLCDLKLCAARRIISTVMGAEGHASAVAEAHLDPWDHMAYHSAAMR